MLLLLWGWLLRLLLLLLLLRLLLLLLLRLLLLLLLLRLLAVASVKVHGAQVSPHTYQPVHKRFAAQGHKGHRQHGCLGDGGPHRGSVEHTSSATTVASLQQHQEAAPTRGLRQRPMARAQVHPRAHIIHRVRHDDDQVR
jgi:hypothetical protein